MQHEDERLQRREREGAGRARLSALMAWLGRLAKIYRGDKRRFACFAKQQPGRARQNFLATTYKPYFSALFCTMNSLSLSAFSGAARASEPRLKY